MCGIFGSADLENNINFDNNILVSLKHRGPDGSGYQRLSKNLYFYHTRLKIIDFSNNNSQPFVSSCGRYTIIFNGELYNYLEIKKKLSKSGYNFTTTGDTEVFLYAFKEK